MKKSISYTGPDVRYMAPGREVASCQEMAARRQRLRQLRMEAFKSLMSFQDKMRQLEADLRSARKAIRIGREGLRGIVLGKRRISDLEAWASETELKKHVQGICFSYEGSVLARQAEAASSPELRRLEDEHGWDRWDRE